MRVGLVKRASEDQAWQKEWMLLVRLERSEYISFNRAQIFQKLQMCLTTSSQLGTGKPWPPGTVLNSTCPGDPSSWPISSDTSFSATIPSASPKITRILLLWSLLRRLDIGPVTSTPLMTSLVLFQSDCWCMIGPYIIVFMKLWTKPLWWSNCHWTIALTSSVSCLTLSLSLGIFGSVSSSTWRPFRAIDGVDRFTPSSLPTSVLK